MSLDQLFQEHRARIGIIGMGYVGLPLACAFGDAGFSVTGFDVDENKVRILNEGGSYIGTVPAEAVGKLVATERLRASSDFSLLNGMNAIIICVPTPLTAHLEPDLSYVERTAETIALYLNRGQLIVLESTTYPGTTREVVKPILERQGLKAGRDFWLAYSPEREDPGRKSHHTKTTPKVVGGLDAESGRLAALLYGQVVEQVVPVSSTDAAEAAKILENIYRSVNIALVNELKVLFDRMGIDIWEVIAAASTKPFGFQPFYPGPGLGGHCIPIDPFYLAWKAREYDIRTRFIELAGEVNTSMPRFVVTKISEALNDRGRPVPGSKVLVLGVAYKPDVEDVRESPSLKVMELLMQRGAAVQYHDPHVPRTHRMRHHDLDLASVPLTDEALAAADAVVILTDHKAVDYGRVVRHARLVVDTRNATRDVTEGREKIVKA